MKKQIAIALTAALLAFPVAPVMADTTSTETTSVTTTSTEDTTTTNLENDVTNTSTEDVTDENATDENATDENATEEDATDEDVTVQDENGEEVDPGVLPDSPLYWFQTLIEKVQLALTFDPAKKAVIVEQQAVENLAEAEALIEEGELEEAEKTLTVYSEKVERAQAFLEEIEDPNSEAAQEVQVALTKVNTQNIVVLSGLLEKLPPQAAQRIALNIVRSLEKAVAKAERMEGKTETPVDGEEATETTTVDQDAEVNDSTATDDEAELKKQAKKALEDFQVGLGLKKAKNTPNGNAYGYYKNKQAHEEPQVIEDDEEQDEESNLTEAQEETQVNESTSDSDDQDKRVRAEKGGKADKAAKDKGNRE